jgi:hypothetical protein
MSSLSIGKAWEEAVAFQTRESKLVTPVTLAMFVVPTALTQWFAPFGQQAKGSPMAVFLIFILGIVLGSIGQMAIAALALGWTGSLGEALGRASRRVWGVLAALFIVCAPIMLIGAFALGGTFIAAGITDPTAITPEVLEEHPQAVLIMLLLSIALIIAFVRLSLIDPLAIMERENPSFLISRSWTMTKGHFWRLMAVLLLFGLALRVVEWTAWSVLGSIASLLSEPPTALSLPALFIALISGVVSGMIVAAMAALYARIYAQLGAGQASVPDVKREE